MQKHLINNIHLSIYLSTDVSIYLSIYLSIFQSIYLSIYLMRFRRAIASRRLTCKQSRVSLHHRMASTVIHRLLPMQTPAELLSAVHAAGPICAFYRRGKCEVGASCKLTHVRTHETYVLAGTSRFDTPDSPRIEISEHLLALA